MTKLYKIECKVSEIIPLTFTVKEYTVVKEDESSYTLRRQNYSVILLKDHMKGSIELRSNHQFYGSEWCEYDNIDLTKFYLLQQLNQQVTQYISSVMSLFKNIAL